MTNKEAIHLIEIVRDCGGYRNTNDFLFTDAFNKAIEALEKMEQCCGNCIHHNDGDYWCSERNLETDDDMHCSDWREEDDK